MAPDRRFFRRPSPITHPLPAAPVSRRNVVRVGDAPAKSPAPPSADARDRPPMFEQTFKNLDDVLRKEAGCSSELDYTEQTSWLLFLKYLDDLEHEKADKAVLTGETYAFILDEPHR